MPRTSYSGSSRKSVMEHGFSQVPKAEIPRSSFDRSHGLKTTFDAGLLIPIFVDEALPGDTFNLDMTGFARMATPIFPIMDNAFMETFFFFVPNRLIWDNWEKFNGEQRNPGDSTDFLIPTVNSEAGFVERSIYDYMGIPTDVPDIDVNSLHLRAYNLIYNEWFRDQNLGISIPNPTDNGPDFDFNFTLVARGKRHDYFTSCLPFPQKGDSVLLPLGDSAPIHVTSDNNQEVGIFSIPQGDTVAMDTQGGAGDAVNVTNQPIVESFGMFADLSSATSATINEIRQAFQIQKLLERDARGGTRYTEVIRAHFGVTSPDMRLQRPEYLGGGSSPVIVNPVPQTSETDPSGPDASPQGNLAAFATVNLHNHGFTKSFTEHGVLIGLIMVRADLTYQQGLNRMWSRQTRFDYYWPALSHIGEQAVLNQEIFTQGSGDATADAAVFGFQERYAEYRYKPSQITGLFRSNHALTLDSWHLSEDFPSLPVLDEVFIREDPPFDRVLAVPSEPHFIFDGYFRLRCARPMPMFGVPGLIDHF